MDSEKAIVLSQIINSMEEASQRLEEAYNKNDKKSFDSSKMAILEFYSQINRITEEK